MHDSARRPRVLSALTFLATTWAAACGEGGGTEPTPPPQPNRPPVVLSGSIPAQTVVAGSSVTINAADRLTAWTTDTTDTYGYLLNSAYDTIDQNDDGPFQSRVNFQVEDNSASSGTYYVRVRGFSRSTTTGPYVIHADDHGNPREYPTDRWREASADSLVNAGSITVPGNRDYFGFYVPTTADYNLGTTGNTDTYGILYAADGTRLGENDDGGPSTNFLITRRLNPGEYFVEVRGFARNTGSYELSVWVSSGAGSVTRLPVPCPARQTGKQARRQARRPLGTLRQLLNRSRMDQDRHRCDSIVSL